MIDRERLNLAGAETVPNRPALPHAVQRLDAQRFFALDGHITHPRLIRISVSHPPLPRG